MKIAMVFPDPKSEKGISAYSLNLIENINKQGIEMKSITFMQGKPLTFLKKLSSLLKYDIIHIQHEYNLLGWYGIPYFLFLPFLGKAKKKKLIVTMHTVLSQNEKFLGGKLKTLLRKILYKTQNRCIDISSAKIIVHSEAFKKILVNEYHISDKKVIVLPHAIIEDIQITDKNKAKEELNLSGNVYLLIGTLGPSHGHDIILRQADKIGKTILVATNPTVVNYRNESQIKESLILNQDIVKKNNFEKFVRFDLGEIDYKKWWKYFSAADLILLPYRGGIGSGIFADAMATKKPVIANNIPYFKEIAKNYNCIKIAETEEDFPKQINEAMKPLQYKKMIQGCEKFLKENGLTPMSKKYKKIYQSLN
ncbi:MAG: glycosyltransferase family 4 protein [Candidatus Pacearchaeota archaeon]|jgi:glycosyltransferase involved in cell wall biosynthesis